MEISSYNELNDIAKDSTINLTDDIHIPPNFQVNSLPNFTGLFNGNGYTIKNLKNPLFLYISGNGTVKNLQLQTPKYIGKMENLNSRVFGFISCETKGTIKNITIKEAVIDVKNSLKTGGITGSVEGLHNAGIIENCTVSGKITSVDVCGGIAGRGHYTQISDCKFHGEVKGGNSGGIVGELQHSTVTNSKSDGIVKGGFVGGLIGTSDWSDIYNCGTSANVFVTGTGGGGFAGHLYRSEVQNSYSTGEIRGEEQENIEGFSSKCVDTDLSNIYWDFKSSRLTTKHKNEYSVDMQQDELETLISTLN